MGDVADDAERRAENEHEVDAAAQAEEDSPFDEEGAIVVEPPFLAMVEEVEDPDIEDSNLLDSLITEENGNWAFLQIDPKQVSLNHLQVEAQLATIQHMLMKLGLTEEEIDLKFKNLYLKTLRKVRTDLEPIIREARMKAAGIEAPPTLMGPNGETILK
jgi:hypothetical protein